MKKTEKMYIALLIFVVVLFIVMFIARRAPAEVHGNVQFGYIEEIDAFEAEINIQYTPIHFFTLYGGISVLMEFHYPYRDTYIIGTKINITEHLYVDLYHHCVHPVYSYAEQFYDKFAGGNKTRMAFGIQW